MKRLFSIAVLGLAWVLATSVALFGAEGQLDASRLTYHDHVLPLLQRYCFDCHADGAKKGGIAFDTQATYAALLADRKLWEQTLLNIRSRAMPPEDKKSQPTLAERELIQAWIDFEVFKCDCNQPDPGRVTLRRLNRAEYNNTIRDLVGVNFRPADDFPADDAGYGFDNIGDVLSLPPVLLEKYLAAADKILGQAILPAGHTQPMAQRIRADTYTAGAERGRPGGESKPTSFTFSVPKAGRYRLRIPIPSIATANQSPPFCASLDGQPCGRFELQHDGGEPPIQEVEVQLWAGHHVLSLSQSAERRTPATLAGQAGAASVPVAWVEVVEAMPNSRVRRLPNELLVSFNAVRVGEGWVGLSTLDEDDVSVDFHAARTGEYVVRAHAWAMKVDFPMPPAGAHFQRTLRWVKEAATEPMPMTFLRDGEKVREVLVTAPESAPRTYEHKMQLVAGKHRLSVAVFRDKFGLTPEESVKFRAGRERRGKVFVHYLEIEGPPDRGAELLADRHRRIFYLPEPPATTSLAARAIIERFTARAYRRSVAVGELDRLMTLFALGQSRGETFEASVTLALKAVLVSPHFLFRGELQPEPDNPRSVHPVGEFALASRLSYFLWSSMPDATLLQLAERGQLRQNLDRQVRRMLADPKSRALVENFAGQWLQLRNLAVIQPDKERFPTFDGELVNAMQQETELLFEHIMRSDRSILAFLTADYTFVNERLASHYGMPGGMGESYRRVSLRGQPRAGVLTHASVLALTSNPTRTSPVKRGKWVLENLLASPPPPPAPNVPELDEQKELTGTLRQRMVQHRANPACAGCHARMDAIGFGLENFDAIGRFRSHDAGVEIDPTGELGVAAEFHGPVALTRILASQQADDFIRCFGEKLLTYALGRGLEYYDRCAIKALTQRAAQRGYTFAGFVQAVVESVPFQKRRGEGDVPFREP